MCYCSRKLVKHSAGEGRHHCDKTMDYITTLTLQKGMAFCCDKVWGFPGCSNSSGNSYSYVHGCFMAVLYIYSSIGSAQKGYTTTPTQYTWIYN